jgi:hypothetical protein
MNAPKTGGIVLVGTISLLLSPVSPAALENYWPLNETSGTIVPNAVAGGISGTIFNGVSWVTDPVRGRVLQFDGVDGYVDLGATTTPVMTLTNNYTWSFWSNSVQPSLNGTTPNNNVIVGNRYNADGVDFVPREFIKFTQSQFEFHRADAGENINYADMPQAEWIHNVVMKNGSQLVYFRNGSVLGSQRITLGTNNPQPLYFGGSQAQENWEGSLDDVATWNTPLPLSSVVKLAKGAATPAQVATTPTVFTSFASDNFNTLNQWIPTNRGLENNAEAGYTAPSVAGGKLTLGGTTNSQYWYGTSIETLQTFSASVETLVSVDRLALSGAGTAYRSSLWLIGDDGHYMHFSQNLGENGWSWNARDDGGIGTVLPTGSGNNIGALDVIDADAAQHKMSLQLVPTGTAGDVFIYILLDGNVVGGQEFTNFPPTFTVALTGQARAIGDSVTAEFDNFLVQTVIPEPATFAMLGMAGTALFGFRRRRH